jgi:hypothetical protein
MTDSAFPVLVRAAIYSVVVLAVCRPLVKGRIKPNPFYGFRTAKTMSDARLWYLSNSYAARQFSSGALVDLLWFGALYLTPLHNDAARYANACLIVIFASLLIAIVLTARYIKRL